MVCQEEIALGRGIKLTKAQWDELDRLRFTTPSAKVFRNCLIVLKSSLGKSRFSIAEELGCGPDTVARAHRQYRQGGAQALTATGVFNLCQNPAHIRL